jgi:ABC-type polar amino acid transport system ATPase subunit
MDPPTIEPGLKIRGLKVSYGCRSVLAGFDFDLRPKSCTAIVGYSGCGKSTVLKSIVGLAHAEAGEGWLNGEQFLVAGSIAVHPWSLRRSLTLVTQQSGLQPYMTVLDNIILAITAVMGLTRNEAVHRSEEIASRLGLQDKLSSYPDQLSGGELQRAHLAKALVLEPKIFLLDEITSNVDPRTSESIGRALQYLHDSRGTSIVFISHDFATVKNLADRIIFLHEGKNFEEVTGQTFPEGFKTPEGIAFAAKTNTRVDYE